LQNHDDYRRKRQLGTSAGRHAEVASDGISDARKAWDQLLPACRTSARRLPDQWDLENQFRKRAWTFALDMQQTFE
jgi:hypothetical protein